MEKNKRLLDGNGDVSYIGHYEEAEDRMTIETVQDVAPYLEKNRQQAISGTFDKKAPMRKMASIPLVIIEKWLREEGLDVFNADHQTRLMRKLHDPAYAYLRTLEGRYL
jgi:hypothetical protein